MLGATALSSERISGSLVPESLVVRCGVPGVVFPGFASKDFGGALLKDLLGIIVNFFWGS